VLSGSEPFTTTGAGDAQIGVRHALTNPESLGRFSAVAIYGLALPTGSGNDRTKIAENVAFTRGAPVAVLGGECSLRAGRSTISGRAEAQYPLGDDSTGYRFATTRLVSVVVSHPLAGEKFSWLAGASTAYSGIDTFEGNPVATRGGLITRGTAGILWSVKRGRNIGLLYSRLIAADMNGDPVSGEGQLVARHEVVVAWQGTFGTHRHPVEGD